MKWSSIALILLGLLSCSLNLKRHRRWNTEGVHHRHPFTDGPAIGPSKMRVYKDVPLNSPPGALEHETQYWHDTKDLKRNSPEAYYNGGESGATALPAYTVQYGQGGQRKALFPRVRGLRYYSRLHKKRLHKKSHLWSIHSSYIIHHTSYIHIYIHAYILYSYIQIFIYLHIYIFTYLYIYIFIYIFIFSFNYYHIIYFTFIFLLYSIKFI